MVLCPERKEFWDTCTREEIKIGINQGSGLGDDSEATGTYRSNRSVYSDALDGSSIGVWFYLIL